MISVVLGRLQSTGTVDLCKFKVLFRIIRATKFARAPAQHVLCGPVDAISPPFMKSVDSGTEEGLMI